MTGTVLELPDALRSELKAPLGPIFTDAEALLREASEPVISVGDVVTYHLLEAGHTPAVALVDERTERAAVAPEISERIGGHGAFDRVLEATNPPATLSAELLAAMATALDQPGTTLIQVDGEEDLAALPAAVMAPAGASVVYGQPGEGMVLGSVDEQLRDEVWNILTRMDGDVDRFRELVEDG